MATKQATKSTQAGATPVSDGDGDGSEVVGRFQNGQMQTTVFLREGKYSLAFTKRYFDRSDETWKNSNTLFVADIPNALRCLERALSSVEERLDRNG